jgi:hypothetical protein
MGKERVRLWRKFEVMVYWKRLDTDFAQCKYVNGIERLLGK